jgi:UDP-N-acetylglucosamine 2-epimerase
MRVLSVVGARPQFVKLGPVSRALRARGIAEFVLHTGQHYDDEMSAAFFREFSLPAPDENLGVAAASPVRQIGLMLPRIADVIERERPDLALVFGDTSSTLAGALAAAGAGVPVAHVEAGMRSFDRSMPEEIHRVATDHLSSLLLTASPAAARNLRAEGLGDGVFAGDVMFDVVLESRDRARARTDVLERFGVAPGGYVFATVHRAANTGEGPNLGRILRLLAALGLPVVFAVHPRTRKAIAAAGLEAALDGGGVRPAGPLPYLETLALVAGARRVFTDSGGLQKEAFYLGVPCTTLREETEWVETVELGWNVLVGTDAARARATLDLPPPPPPRESPYGDGTAGRRIAEAIATFGVPR